MVGNPPTNNLRESDSVGGVRFHFLSADDGTGTVAVGAPGSGASINGPPTTATGTSAGATTAGLLAAACCCCSRAEEIVRGLHGARGGVVPLVAVPALRTPWSAMPCCGLDAMLGERLSLIGGWFTTTVLLAAIAAVICSSIFLCREG